MHASTTNGVTAITTASATTWQPSCAPPSLCAPGRFLYMLPARPGRLDPAEIVPPHTPSARLAAHGHIGYPREQWLLGGDPFPSPPACANGRLPLEPSHRPGCNGAAAAAGRAAPAWHALRMDAIVAALGRQERARGAMARAEGVGWPTHSAVMNGTSRRPHRLPSRQRSRSPQGRWLLPREAVANGRCPQTGSRSGLSGRALACTRSGVLGGGAATRKALQVVPPNAWRARRGVFTLDRRCGVRADGRAAAVTPTFRVSRPPSLSRARNRRRQSEPDREA
eukprot:44801-Chlamydomonas_euryale.AAC.4